MQSFKGLFSLFRPSLVTTADKIGIRFIRGERKFPFRQTVDGEWQEDEDEVLNQLEKFEDMLGQTDQSDPKIREELKRMEQFEREFTKRKILQKKFFKKPPEMNLLTWAAKEQIRYLNSEFPEEWTVDRLADSFPTDRNVIIKVLKSKYLPRNESEILKHDDRVYKNWKAITSGGNDIEGPINPNIVQLLESKKSDLMLNAAGNISLPMPSGYRTRLKLLESSGKLQKSGQGPFSKIIEDYEKQKSVKDEKMKGSLIGGYSLLKFSDSIQKDRKLLEGIVGTDLDIVPQVSKKNQNPLNECPSLLPTKTETGSSNKETGSRTLLSRRERKLLKQNDSGINVNLSNIKTLQMLETKKVTHPDGQIYDSAENDDIIKAKQKENAEIHSDFSSNVWSKRSSFKRSHNNKHDVNLKYEEIDFDDRGVSKGQQAYIYDDEHGYQHPRGMYDKSLQSVKIAKSRKKSGKLYQKGRVVYDEDGEFLYRIP